HGDGALRAARRRRLGRGRDLVRDERDAGAPEFRGAARGEPAVQPGDRRARRERDDVARGAAGLHHDRARFGAPQLERDGRARRVPPRDGCVDGQRRTDSGEDRRPRASAGGLAGVPVPMKVTRRQFVKGGVAAFTVTFVAPEFLSDLARAQGAHTRNLVVLNLSGGNDALSMLVPYNDPFYYSRRPTIAVPAGQVLQIGRDSSNVALGLHPRLTGLRTIFDAGRLALI